MTSFYSIIRYVPDPVTGEQVNVGVAVFGDGSTRLRFTRDWQRLRLFGSSDIQFLRDFTDSVIRASSGNLTLPGFEEPIELTEESIRRLAGKWMNSIQFSDVRTSLLPADELLVEIEPRVLRSRKQRAKRPYRTRRAAASLVTREMENGLREAVGTQWERFYRKRPEVAGRLQGHHFDVSIENGRPLLAARGLSFEGPPSIDLEREIRVTAWALDDIRDSKQRIELAVVALPPERKSRVFDDATRVFHELGGSLVLENEVRDWVEAEARELGLV